MYKYVNRPMRYQRRGLRGQTMALFALLAIFLFAVTGLAIDAGLAYLTDNGAERAAAAGALAGVPYMPTGYGTTANQAALAASARNGFTNGTQRNGHPITVSVSQYPAGCVNNPPCDPNKLTVSVSAYVQTSFMEVLGFGSHPVTATDTAYYLPPISLGQPGAQLGSTVDQLGTSGNYYIMRSEGYGNPRSEGDAYDPNNQQQTFSCGNNVTENTASQGTSTDNHLLSATRGTEVLNSTLQTDGFNPLPTRGGYNFSINVPSTVSQASVQVYNPAFAPDSGYTTNGTANYNMHEQDTSFSGNGYQDQYSAMEYTLFSVTDIFDHTQDVPISQMIIDPVNAPSDGNTSNFSDARTGVAMKAAVVNKIYHTWMDVANPPSLSWNQGGNGYSLFTPVVGMTNPNSASSHGYATLTGGAAGQTYRLRIDMLDYQGLRPVDDNSASLCSRAHKGYALRLAVPAGGGGYTACAVANCNLSAISEMAIYTPIANTGSFNIPVFSMSKYYAGKTVDVYVYDPGDVGGTNTLSFIDPDNSGGSCAVLSTPGRPINVNDLGVSQGNAPTNANLVQNMYSGYSPAVQPNNTVATINTVTGTGGGSSNIFNGHWLLFALPIPANYQGGGSNCGSYWQLQYSVANGNATDTITIAVSFGGSPVHLI